MMKKKQIWKAYQYTLIKKWGQTQESVMQENCYVDLGKFWSCFGNIVDLIQKNFPNFSLISFECVCTIECTIIASLLLKWAKIIFVPWQEGKSQIIVLPRLTITCSLRSFYL